MKIRGGWLASLCIGLLVATVILALLEGALRLLPVERWERDHPNVSYPLFIPGEGVDADYYVTNPHFRNSMAFNRFARVKAPGAKRVFVLGGSAALGWPGVAESSFSGYMQRALDAAAPGRFEVINVAAMAYGSHRVLDLLTDVVQMEPDLILVWSGNNEYVERNALPRLARSPLMARLQRGLRHCMTYRTIRLGLQWGAPSLFARPAGEDFTDPRRVSQVRHGMLGRSAESDRQILANYRDNLRTMAGMIRAAGATGVFCTVPVNLSGWRPLDAPPEIADPVRATAWRELMLEATRLREEGRFAPAVLKFEQVLVETPDYALAHFLLGDCCRRLGRDMEALGALQKACDLDPRPARALSQFQTSVREIAGEEGMLLVDLQHALLEKSGRNLSGLDLFLDYVHPNDDGHRFVAMTVLEKILPIIAPQLPLPVLTQHIESDDWRDQNRINPADIHYTLGMTLFNNGDYTAARQAYLQALDADPSFADAAGNLGVLYDRLGDPGAAKKYYALAVRLDPGTTHAANYAGLLYRLGDLAGAWELGTRLQRQGVVDARLMIMLGHIAFDERRFGEALELFRQALTAGGESAALQTKIGDTLKILGDEAGSRAAYERAAFLR